MAVDIISPVTCSVSTSIEISHTYHIVNDVVDAKTSTIVTLYEPYKRCLAMVDHRVYDLYGDQMRIYFEAYNIAATIHPVNITEDQKSIETLVQVYNWITEFDLLRRGPVLVIGGGLLPMSLGSA